MYHRTLGYTYITYLLRRLRKDIIDCIKDNVLMLFIPELVIQLADIHWQQDSLAVRMILYTHSVVTRRFMTAYIFRRTRTPGCKDGKQRSVGFFKVVQPQIEFPEQQRLEIEALEYGFVRGTEIKPRSVVLDLIGFGAEQVA